MNDDELNLILFQVNLLNLNKGLCVPGRRRGLVKPWRVYTGFKCPHSPFAFVEINQHGEFQSTHDRSIITANQPLLMQVWQQRPSCLKPVRYCCMRAFIRGPESSRDGANVLTSLPFIALGIKPQENLNTTLVYQDLSEREPEVTNGGFGYFLPVQPLMVFSCSHRNDGGSICKQSIERARIKDGHNVHKMSSLLGGVLFIADDVFHRTPFIHAAWHLAAAVGVATCNKLLE
ncbi:hypothetical protein F3Y22_tig00110325pilonHSYRG00124 [Hibiscus syriacus]|uniref:Uncharacterized protein n=1 Tax=Hibiscus syriacus TaxID=106335 RepID=A0A6A3AZP5_HIBSY|nr:hypothetical protein F3Y22_tig00110325pilonHSYRG00124 [Hibiscus syriacus]